MPRVAWNGEALAARILSSLMDGAEEWARADAMPLAVENCPIDQGALRGSQTVEREDNSVVMGFGGQAAPYAVIVHEDQTAHHPVGKAKFLEDSFNEKLPDLPEKIADRIKGVL